MDGLLIDIEGVLSVAWEPVPGAVDALARLRQRGVPLRLVTNTTSRTRQAVADSLVGAGFDIETHEILSAPAATGAYLRRSHPGARCFLVNHGDLSEDLEGITLVEADAEVVVLGGAGPEFDHERLNRAFTMLLDGAELVAMHRGLSWRTALGFELDTGAYVAALEAAARVTATVVGKPEAAFFEEARAALGLEAGRVGMVGDDVENDVLAAQACGMHGILVRTGKFRTEALADAPGTPDVVLDSFADVPGLMG